MQDVSASVPFTSGVRREDLPPATLFIDTETYTDGDYQRLMLGCYELWVTRRDGLPSRQNGRDQVVKGLFRNEDQFYRLLQSVGRCRVVAHNWQFDASVLRLGSVATRDKYAYDMLPRSGIYPVASGGFSPFWITLMWSDGVQAEFICNTNFHKTSLARLGESFGLAKLEMPKLPTWLLDVPIPGKMLFQVDRAGSDQIAMTGRPRLDHLLKVIKYCKRDVEILRRSWFALFEFTKDYGVTPGLTVASMAQRVYAKQWLPKLPMGQQVIGNRHIPALSEPEREAYRGGRVEVFYEGCPGDVTLNKYDANSMYPSVMVGPVPTSFQGVMDPADLALRLEQDYDAQGLNLAEVTVSIPSDGIGWLGWEGVRDPDRGLVFPVGTFRLWTWTPLLRVAHRHGWIKQVHNCYDYAAHPIFTEYVNDVYALRKEVKASNPPRALLLKYLLNSVYGKFGQGNYGEWILTEGKEAQWQELIQAEHGGPARWTDYPTGDVSGEPLCDYWGTGKGIYRWKEPEDGLGRRAVCSIAGYITCAARAKLLLTMHALHRNGSRIFMCDTDSIVTDGILPGELTGKELGAWDLEEVSSGKDCDFRAPKHYTFGGNTKTKGIRNPQRGVNEYKQVQFSKWATDFMTPKPERRKRLETGAMVKDIDKTITGRNNKRISQGEGRPTLPIVYDGTAL